MDRRRDHDDLSIPSIYRDPSQYDLLAQMTAPQDLGFYRGLADRQGSPLLELACGTGRICLALALEGLDCVGVDISPAMIESARHKAKAARLDVELRVGDIRDLDLGRTFKLVLLPYNSLNHLLTTEHVERFVDSCLRHLDADSRLVIDTFNPNPQALFPDGSQPCQLLLFREPLTGSRVKLFEQTHYDTASQVNHITWRYEIDGRPDARVDELQMRIFFPQELDALLTRGGLQIEQKLGGYDGSPFGSGSAKQLTVCRCP